MPGKSRAGHGRQRGAERSAAMVARVFVVRILRLNVVFHVVPRLQLPLPELRFSIMGDGTRCIMCPDAAAKANAFGYF